MCPGEEVGFQVVVGRGCGPGVISATPADKVSMDGEALAPFAVLGEGASEGAWCIQQGP